MALPVTPPNEVRALAQLGFDELRRFPGGIGQMQNAVADRAFRAVGWGAKPTEFVYRGVTRRVYSGLSGAFGLVGRGADSALERARIGEERLLSVTPWGSGVIAVIDGLIGDALEREQNVLQEPMAVRVDGQPIPPEPDALAAAFPQATGRVVVFVHGLMGTEFPWWLHARERGGTYGTRLKRDLGFTPVYVRYNTGRHISENGRSLAELLEAVVDAWPVPVEEVALVGHSMGGLVSRSACHCASEDGLRWVRKVRHVVSLGSPHMGAPLAQLVHYASAGLSALPETKPFGNFLRRRSAGIRDLRQGSLVDEDWRDCDPDALRAQACREVPLLEGAAHHFVAATITHSPKNPMGRLVGDTLVLEPSASGRSRTRRIPFKVEHGMHLGRAHHIALLNHPAVYAKLRTWLETPPEEVVDEVDAVAAS
jgi:pimeloyl-ACP methyl ester carboxylesterase